MFTGYDLVVKEQTIETCGMTTECDLDLEPVLTYFLEKSLGSLLFSFTACKTENNAVHTQILHKFDLLGSNRKKSD